VAVDIPLLISVDDHVLEPPDLWRRWLPARFKEVGPKIVNASYEVVTRLGGRESLRQDPKVARQGRYRIASDGPKTDFWMYEDMAVATTRIMAVAGLSDDEVSHEPISFQEMRPAVYKVKERLADMDLNHTERSLCFPTFPRFCGQIFLEAADKDLALACVQAYNDWMVEEWAGESGGRLIPLCLIPLWDAGLAAVEIRRNAVRGVRAVAFSEGPDMLGLPSIYELDYWQPFLVACEETGTTICMHIGSSSSPILRPNLMAAYALSHITAEVAAVDWCFGGALAQYPKLKIAFSESQVGWMDFLFRRLDSTWHKQKDRAISSELAWMTEPPSSYLGNRVFGCAFEDDLGIANRGTPLGIDCLTFETDYPHTDSTWPNTKEYAEKVFVDYTQEEVDKVFRKNAIRMLELPECIS
jgi:predicted TIM-barrel fold metal-dependent hydrolase